MSLQKNLLFVLVMGIALSLLLIGNFVLNRLIGYWVIYTGIAVVFFTMFLLIKTYKAYLGKDLRFPFTLLIGFPVFLVGTFLFSLFLEYNSPGTTIYSYYRYGIVLNTLEETIKVAFPVTVVFVLVFVPIYRLIMIRLKAIKGTDPK